MKGATFLLGFAPIVAAVATDALPANVQNFINAIKPGKCSGSDALATGFHNSDGNDSGEWAYCQQSVAGQAIFIKGNNKFANMDIDCDGNQTGGGAGTRCGASQDTQSETAFKDTVESYGISDLNANIHPYVVFGNEGSYSPTFAPQKHGIEPLSVMAVVCDNKLIYGIWGDTNGDDGPPLVGEASLSLATACFGNSVNGNSGHDQDDVLYIAFTGADAVPGKTGAKWDATSYDDFESSIKALGDKLVTRLGGGTEASNSTTAAQSTSSSTATILATSTRSTAPSSSTTIGTDCEWTGHCAGASCKISDDCSGEMTCNSGHCAST